MISPALQKFLDLIAFSERTSTSHLTINNGYDVIVTGVDGPEIFTDYAFHPFASGRPAKLIRANPPLRSTASGRYQLLIRWWIRYKVNLNLPDFSPTSQDAVALQQLKEQGAVDLILAGDIEGAIKSCSNIWASFPGNNYGQNAHSIGTLLDKYGEEVA